MKVAAIILMLGSVSALKSGPYLPSGWRPEGPAFYLPSEPRPPVVIPPVDFILHGSEASGSEFLREYGPPKVQALPDPVSVEPAFVVLQARITEQKTEASVEAEDATEVITDLKYEIVEDASTTESSVTAAEVEEPAVEERSNLVKEEIEVETATQEVEATEQKVVEESDQTELTGEVKAVEGVKNIAETIVSLEKEEASKVQLSQDLTAVKTEELNSGNVGQVPEGFLEYGPPGFTEYGPPNPGPRTANDIKTEDEKIANNETRKRRFSPKFRSTKAKKN